MHLFPFRRLYKFYGVCRLSLPRPVRREHPCSPGPDPDRCLRDRSGSLQPLGRGAATKGRTKPADVLCPNRQCVSRTAAGQHTRTFEKGDLAARSFIEEKSPPGGLIRQSWLSSILFLIRIPALPRIETPVSTSGPFSHLRNGEALPKGGFPPASFDPGKCQYRATPSAFLSTHSRNVGAPPTHWDLCYPRAKLRNATGSRRNNLAFWRENSENSSEPLLTAQSGTLRIAPLRAAAQQTRRLCCSECELISARTPDAENHC